MNRRLISLVALWMCGLITIHAQTDCPPLACNDHVQISLPSCKLEIKPDMILENARNTDPYTIQLYGPEGEFLEDTLRAEYSGVTLNYKVFDQCGNSCWGTITPEINLVVPTIPTPCEYTPGIDEFMHGNISPPYFDQTLEVTTLADCHTELLINLDAGFFYNASTHQNPLWIHDEAQVQILDPNGNQVGPILLSTGNGALITTVPTTIHGTYSIIVSPVNIASIGSFDLYVTTPACNPDCVSWCGSVPENFVTVDQIYAEIDKGCSAPIQGEIFQDMEVTGDICDPQGQLHVVSYYGKILRHGQIENVLMLKQAYYVQKIDLGTTDIVFPNDVMLNCGDIATPESIYALTGSGTQAYPHFIDKHTFIPDTIVTETVEHYEEVIGQHDEMTVFEVDLNGDGIMEQVWGVVTVVDKILRDTIVLDTFIDHDNLVNPLVPVIDKVCNLVVTYSDTEYPACATGVKIVRKWSIIDWCDGTMRVTDNQSIEVSDQEAPMIMPLDDQFISLEPWTCQGELMLPELEIIDNCATEFDIRYLPSRGFIENGKLVGAGVTTEPFPVEIIVADDCGNSDTTSFQVFIQDDVRPVPVCQDQLQVSLTFDGANPDSIGVAKIWADAFDAGSHDAGCSDVTVQVIRLEDTQTQVTDCFGNELGYAPVTCHPITEEVDLGCFTEGKETGPIAVPGDYVKFCCADVGQTVMVIVIVTDGFGNENQCMVEVEVVNKGSAFLICEDIEIDCIDSFDDIPRPQIVGGICNEIYDIQLVNEEEIAGTCGADSLLREWFVDYDASGDLSPGDAYCEQVVRIRQSSKAFNPYTIKWPKHYDGTLEQGINVECDTDGVTVLTTNTNVMMGNSFICMPEPAGGGVSGEEGDIITGKPVWCDTECGLVGYSLESDTVVGSDACLKILNRWTVVDWCLWEANDGNIDDENDSPTDQFIAVEDWAQGQCTGCPEYGPAIDDPVYFQYTAVDMDGYYTFDQVIKIVDDTAPEIMVADTVVVATNGGNASKDENGICLGSEVIVANAVDFCGGIESAAQFLKWEVEITDEAGDPVNNALGSNSKTGTGPEITMGTREGKIGEVRRIKWVATDGCGNSMVTTTVVIFGGDTKAPTPLCVSGLTSVIMPTDGISSIWAKDFNLGSFDNCSSTDELFYTIVFNGEDPIRPGEEGFEDQANIILDCSMLANSFAELDMWVWDPSGNGDFCSVTILFTDGCPADGGISGDTSSIVGANISGFIYTEAGDMIQDTKVSMNTNLPEYPVTMLTEDDGLYTFSSNPMSHSYIINAQKNNDPLNGISTHDLVLMQKHVLGIELFQSPFNTIAADINNDERVTAADLVELRKIILGIYDDFPANKSWRFIDAEQTFDDALNPWPIDEDLNISNLQTDMDDQNFIGIKIGDVSGNASANNAMNINTRSDDAVALSISEQSFVTDDIITVPVSAEIFDEVFGFQFNLMHHGLTLIDVIAGDIDINGQHFNPQTNSTSFSWHTNIATHSNKVLFTLRFKANIDAAISEVLKIDLRNRIHAELYQGKALEIYNLGLEISDVMQPVSDYVLYQNQPNPFQTDTKIGFSIPSKQRATLTVFDNAGRTVYTQTDDFDAGYNVIELTKANLGNHHILYYRLESGSFEAMRKMILIE